MAYLDVEVSGVQVGQIEIDDEVVAAVLADRQQSSTSGADYLNIRLGGGDPSLVSIHLCLET